MGWRVTGAVEQDHTVPSSEGTQLSIGGSPSVATAGAWKRQCVGFNQGWGLARAEGGGGSTYAVVIIETEPLGGNEGELCTGTEWQVGALLRRRLWGHALEQGSWKRGGVVGAWGLILESGSHWG